MDGLEAALNILVVDDEVAVTVSIGLALKSRGHAVDRVYCAADALQRIGEFPAHYQLLITDHLMPEVTGLQLVRQLKQTAFQGKVIVLSAHLTPELEAEYSRAGVDKILQKPFELEELRSAVEKAGADSQLPAQA